MKANRLDEMEQYILDRRFVEMEDLCHHFQISLSTLRRDLDTLVARGKIEKVYGGAKACENGGGAPLLSYEVRDIVNRDAKRAICEKAAALVEEGDVIYVDTGTSTIGMIEALGDVHCTVITNSLPVASQVIAHENLDMIMLPGHLKRETRSFIDREVDRYLSSLNVDKAFMATTGFSIGAGLTNASELEFIIKKAVVAASSYVYLLADHDKFDKRALYTYCRLEDIDGLITDRKPPREYLKYCKEHQVQVIW